MTTTLDTTTATAAAELIGRNTGLRMAERKPSRLEGFGALLGGGLFNRVMGLARLLVFASLLGPEGFGVFRLAVTSSAIASSLAGFGLHTSFLRYLPEAGSRGAAAAFFRRGLVWSLAGTSIAAVAVYCAPEWFSALVFSDPRYVTVMLLVAASLPITALYKCALGGANGMAAFRASAAGESAQNLAFLALGVAGMIVVARTSEIAFGSFLVAMLAGTFIVARPIPSGPVDADERAEANTLFRRALSYSLWYSMIPLFQYLFDFIDRWALARFYSMEIVGSYSIVPVVTGGMFVFGAAMTPVVARKGAELWGRGARGGAAQLVWTAIAIVTLLGLTYAVALRAAEPILWGLAGAQWRAAGPVVSLFLAYFAFFNIFYLVGSFVSFRETTWVHLAALSAGAVVNTALNLLLVKSHGVFGAAAATLIGMTVTLACYLCFLFASRVRVPPRMWVTMALPLAALAPLAGLVAAWATALLLAWKTNIVMNDTDRRAVRVWIARARPGARRRPAS